MTYQGATCLRATASRSPGLDTDAYEVEMATSAFGALQFRRPDNLYAEVGFLSSVQGAGKLGQRLVPLQGTVEIRGDLVLDDRRGHSVTLESLYVRDDGIEVISEGDDEDGDAVVKLHLVDIRYFWPRRGELWGSYNVRRPDGSYEPGTVPGGDVPAPANASGGTIGDGISTAVRDDGEAAPAWSLRALVEKILPALPGSPKLARAPARLLGDQRLRDPRRDDDRGRRHRRGPLAPVGRQRRRQLAHGLPRLEARGDQGVGRRAPQGLRRSPMKREITFTAVERVAVGAIFWKYNRLVAEAQRD
ncbi:MAG TPA: hypothetical protein VHF22_01735 [Planctomycetota bacterium]|nr:hypothetical protein [Planctomycetota bacterium]